MNEDEKVIIKSTPYNYDGYKIYFIVFLTLCIVSFSIFLMNTSSFIGIIAVMFAFVFFVYELFLSAIYIDIMNYKNNEITVTDKRVYGKACYGEQISLPFDSISSINIGTSFGKQTSINIATSSGNINFKWIGNCNEIYNEVNKLLIKRQK